MSATNELRRLLDTLGVEYYPKAADETVFSTGTEHVHVQDDLIDGCLELFIRPVTPQQAVEATLGRGTCNCTTPDDAWCFSCSVCGKSFPRSDLHMAHNHGAINYCPNCGRKVVNA